LVSPVEKGEGCFFLMKKKQMIEIQNERGQYLQLFPGTKLECELNSWLLSVDNSLLGSYSLPFRFPIEGNESFIEHKHRPESGGFVGISVSVSDNGLPYGNATLSFRVNDNTADGFLRFDSGSVAVKLRSKYIHDAVLNESWALCGLHSELSAAMLTTIDPLTNPYPFVFFPVKNEEFTDPKFERSDYTHSNYVNAWLQVPTNTTPGVFVVDALTTTGNPAVPYFYFHWIVRKVCEYLGFSANGAWIDNPGIKALVMYNEVAISQSGLWDSFKVWAKWHVWQMTIADFFRFLRDEMGVGVFFDATRSSIHFYAFTELKDANEVADLSKDLLVGYTADPVNQTGYAIKFPRDTSDSYQKQIPPIDDFQIGEGESSLSMTLHTLPMTFSTRMFGGRWSTPIARRRGKALGADYNDMGIYDIQFPPENAIPPTLLAYYGLQPDVTGRLYPYGSSINRNAKQEICGPLSVAPDEPDGIFHQYVRPMYEFKTFSKRITLNFWLKYSTLSKLKMWQKIGVGSADMVYLSYLISKLTYQLPMIDGRVLSQAELYPFLPPSANYTPNVPTGLVWVRVVFTPFETGINIEDAISTFTVKFQFFSTKEAVFVASSARATTLFFGYKTRAYDSSTDRFDEQEHFESIVMPANAYEVSIDGPLTFWKFSDPERQKLYEEPYILSPSFTLIPGAGYRIIQ
jgi:hypothetical protein